jgi:hypothetical protein
MIAMVMFFMQTLKYNTISFEYGEPIPKATIRDKKYVQSKKSLLFLEDDEDNKNNFQEYQSQISNFINEPMKRSATIKSRKSPGSSKKVSRKKRFIFF